MRHHASLFLVIPCRNEADRILTVLCSVPSFVDHVIVVDDGSSDASWQVLSEFQREITKEEQAQGRFHFLRHPKSLGVGAALVTGYEHALNIPGAPNDAFCVVAGDGQMDLSELETVCDPVLLGLSDYVKGNRFAKEETKHLMPITRYLGGHVFSMLTSWKTGVPIHDSQCGYTALSRAAAQKLPLRKLWPKYGYPNDLLMKLRALKLRIAEVPVSAIYGPNTSQMKIQDAFRIAKLIFSLSK